VCPLVPVACVKGPSGGRDAKVKAPLFLIELPLSVPAGDSDNHPDHTPRNAFGPGVSDSLAELISGAAEVFDVVDGHGRVVGVELV